jgi:hypothetical protein
VLAVDAELRVAVNGCLFRTRSDIHPIRSADAGFLGCRGQWNMIIGIGRMHLFHARNG